MLSQCPLNQFNLKIRVLLNKAVELLLLAYLVVQSLLFPVVVVTNPGNVDFFSQMAKEKMC